MRTRLLTISFAACLAFSGVVGASNALEQYEGDDKTMKAALKFTEAVYTEDIFALFSRRATQVLIEQRGSLGRFYQTILKFYRTKMPLEELQQYMARIYAQNFTAHELNRMRRFLSTDLGQRVLLTTPGFLEQAARWMVRATQQRQDILARMLKKEQASRAKSQ